MNTAKEIKVAALKSEIAAGIDDLDHGRFQTHTDANITQLADDVRRTGRFRLNGLRLDVAAKVHGKNNKG
jgi:hypothetical protein